MLICYQSLVAFGVWKLAFGVSLMLSAERWVWDVEGSSCQRAAARFHFDFRRANASATSPHVPDAGAGGQQRLTLPCVSASVTLRVIATPAPPASRSWRHASRR